MPEKHSYSPKSRTKVARAISSATTYDATTGSEKLLGHSSDRSKQPKSVQEPAKTGNTTLILQAAANGS